MTNDEHLDLFSDHPDDDDLDALRSALARQGLGESAAEDDDTALIFGDEATPSASPQGRRATRRRARKRRIRKFFSTVIVMTVMALIVAGLGYGAVKLWGGSDELQDYAGVGSTAVVIRVHSGDGLTNVAQTLVDAEVVAQASRFVSMAQESPDLTGLQPGFYWVHQHSSVDSVISELADPAHRIGKLRIIPGQTLADITVVSTDGERSVKPGILRAITASCVPIGDATECFSYDELAQVAREASAAQLGLVAWAADIVDRIADKDRRLEGLILPGDYDIEPGSTAIQALTAVLSASASSWNTTGIVAAAQAQGRTPYELATIASLVEAEGIGPDMRKVARVIDNRLAIGRKLQFDSTVNYGLSRAQIATASSERLDPNNVYSTYAHSGLTPTPINSPGPQAIDAAVDPAQGEWMYFVAIDLEGHSCFSVTDIEHAACVEQARANGVFG